MGAQTAVGSRAYWAAACALRDPGTVGREGGEATVPAHWAKGAGRGATTDGAVLREPTRKEITPGTSCAKQATQDQKAIAGADEQTQEFWIEKKNATEAWNCNFLFQETQNHTQNHPSVGFLLVLQSRLRRHHHASFRIHLPATTSSVLLWKRGRLNGGLQQGRLGRGLLPGTNSGGAMAPRSVK